MTRIHNKWTIIHLLVDRTKKLERLKGLIFLLWLPRDSIPEQLNGAVAVTTENFDLKEAVNNLISKENNDFVCKACGKRDSRIQNMNKHVEIHIEGLTYGCHSCDKTFRSKSSYNNHMYRDKTHKMFQE